MMERIIKSFDQALARAMPPADKFFNACQFSIVRHQRFDIFQGHGETLIFKNYNPEGDKSMMYYALQVLIEEAPALQMAPSRKTYHC